MLKLTAYRQEVFKALLIEPASDTENHAAIRLWLMNGLILNDTFS